jgi:hypothetical protein
MKVMDVCPVGVLRNNLVQKITHGKFFFNAPAALQTLHGVLESQEWAAMRGARNLFPAGWPRLSVRLRVAEPWFALSRAD